MFFFSICQRDKLCRWRDMEKWENNWGNWWWQQMNPGERMGVGMNGYMTGTQPTTTF